MSARNRVRGSGIDRASLPNFIWLDTLRPEWLEELRSIDLSKNDLGEMGYEVCHIFPKLNDVKPPEYTQVLLQGLYDGDPGLDDSYVNWKGEYFGMNVVQYLRARFPSVCRARIATLPPGSKLPKHIDTNTSVACRVQIVLNETGSTFRLWRRTSEDARVFKPGEIWFTNTGWPHEVENPSEEPRHALLFSCHSKDISSFLRPE